MATFEYNAMTAEGRLMKGTIEAGTLDEASGLLEQMKLKVNSVNKAKAEKPKTAIGRNEFLLFNQQLASIAKAGIPLERGLRELAKDVGSRPMRRLINSIAEELEAGVSIEQAFEKRQRDFPQLYGRILKAGVETGRLSEMLTSLNRHLEMARQTRKIIFEAISYPLVVFTLAAIVITGVFMFIIPQFREVLFDIAEGGRLPALTELFLWISQNVVKFWIIAGLIIASFFVLMIFLSTFAGGRRFKESMFMKMPVVGRVYRSSVLSRMAEAIAIMVASGCDMPTALKLGAGATSSENLMLESEIVAKQTEKGINILEAGQFCRMIPRLFFYSIQLGTQRNELQDNLYSLGQMYTEQAKHGQARLQAILLPVMLICVGGFIALTILSMFAPMVSIITSLSAAG